MAKPTTTTFTKFKKNAALIPSAFAGLMILPFMLHAMKKIEAEKTETS